jgi:3-ketoacyl-CoA synthase
MPARKDAAAGAAAPASTDMKKVPSEGSLTAAQWAKEPKEWEVAGKRGATAELSRGYRIDIYGMATRTGICTLGVYAVYLLYCESCKDEYYELMKTLRTATSDALTGTRGSTSAGALVLTIIVWLLTVLWMRTRPKIYLVDFKTYRHECTGGATGNTAGERCYYDKFLEVSKNAKHLDGSLCFNEKSMDFQEKILRTSAISDMSIFPPSFFTDEARAGPADAERESLSMRGAREEAQLMMFKAVEELLAETRTKPEQVDILVVNCSLFCPTPSLSAMIVNRFGMRSDVLSYNLGGMGCSASVIAVDLAARLLSSADNRNSRAIVVSTENITQNWYRGNDRSMLLSNCLFRCGASALLLSNRHADASRARFQMMHTVRTHLGKSDECYRAVFQEEDSEGVRGVRLSKQIMQIAGDALKRNITNLGPLVLPVTEQIKFFCNMLARKLLRKQLPLGPLRKPLADLAKALVPLPIVSTIVGYKKANGGATAANGDGAAIANGASPAPVDEEKVKRDEAVLAKELPPYVPNFTKAFEWICVHTGGRAVIDAIESNLALPSHVLEPSRLSLYRYGNVSSASIWYELELVAEFGNMCGAQREGGAMPPGGKERRLKKGDRIWQIAFGSGFKCNSAVWKCLKNH